MMHQNPCIKFLVWYSAGGVGRKTKKDSTNMNRWLV